MKLKLNLAWKVVVGTPVDGVDYCSDNNHFNIRTGKTFLKKVGGISTLDFFPYTFEPTNVFYHAIEPCKQANDFVGKKLPFECDIVTAGAVKKLLKIKIHRFSPKLVILSVSVDAVEFNGSVHELLEFMRLENHANIFNLVKTICGIIRSGGRSNAPVQNKPKTYPYFELESIDDNDFLSDEVAVELLTRHKNPNSGVIENVIAKNKDHQLDNNSILIDRQSIVARYSKQLGDFQSIQRKYESSHYLFELAIALSNILDDGAFLTLNTDQQNSITKLIKKPNIVFIKSVTGYKTWLLLMEEFKLNDLITELTHKRLMQENQTMVEQIKNRIASHSILAPVIFMGIIVISIGTFTDAVDKIWGFFETRVITQDIPVPNQQAGNNGVQIQGSGNSVVITNEGASQSINNATADSTLIKINKEISFRISVFPYRIEKSRTYTKEVAKSNILSGLYAIPGANHLKPFFPEYSNKSILSLCFDINTLAKGNQLNISNTGCALFDEMNKLSINKYYVHDMYKMSIDKLTIVEDEVEDFYNKIIQAQPAWRN